jgi:hypothetical protein
LEVLFLFLRRSFRSIEIRFAHPDAVQHDRHFVGQLDARLFEVSGQSRNRVFSRSMLRAVEAHC